MPRAAPTGAATPRASTPAVVVHRPWKTGAAPCRKASNRPPFASPRGLFAPAPPPATLSQGRGVVATSGAVGAVTRWVAEPNGTARCVRRAVGGATRGGRVGVVDGAFAHARKWRAPRGRGDQTRARVRGVGGVVSSGIAYGDGSRVWEGARGAGGNAPQVVGIGPTCTHLPGGIAGARVENSKSHDSQSFPARFAGSVNGACQSRKARSCDFADLAFDCLLACASQRLEIANGRITGPRTPEPHAMLSTNAEIVRPDPTQPIPRAKQRTRLYRRYARSNRTPDSFPHCDAAYLRGLLRELRASARYHEARGRRSARHLHDIRVHLACVAGALADRLRAKRAS